MSATLCATPSARAFLALTVLLVASSARGAGVPRLDHVFIIVGENMRFEDVTETHAAEAPYLNGLARDHVRHAAFYGVTHPSLGNYTALVSGQIPGWLDRQNCPSYGSCLRAGPTLADQLDRRGLTWRGYFESMPRPCARPAELLDEYRVGYATRHNPFVYFQEVVADEGYCGRHVIPLERNLTAALESAAPNFALIVPNTCNDGHDANCRPNETRLQVFDGWLERQVPPILEFLRDHPRAALFITFDESDPGDAAACCNQKPGAGGGHVDLVMVAPRLESAAGHRVTEPANHYSLLRTVEDAFGLAPLGEAEHVAPITGLFLPWRRALGRRGPTTRR